MKVWGKQTGWAAFVSGGKLILSNNNEFNSSFIWGTVTELLQCGAGIYFGGHSGHILTSQVCYYFACVTRNLMNWQESGWLFI